MPVKRTAPTAQRIRAWRKKLGLTQVEAAALLGVSARSLQGWEAEENVPKPYLELALRYAEGMQDGG